eukprot:854707-Ditylum_brightwellii.AAC.1
MPEYVLIMRLVSCCVSYIPIRALVPDLKSYAILLSDINVCRLGFTDSPPNPTTRIQLYLP